jgi:nucleotide-binding universal stress UspA family protein
MTPHERRGLRARQQKLDRAIEVLKRHPDFPATQVQILESTKAAMAALTETEKQFGTAARLESVLRLLDVRARGYLGLVASMESQEALMIVLDELGRQAWKEYTGFHIEMLQPVAGDPQYQSIRHRLSDWIGEGYKRLVPTSGSSSQNAGHNSNLKSILMEPSELEQARPTPKAFISYSWETEEHRRWVLDFATRLRRDGVDVTLDQWEVQPGDQLPAFMERAVRENDYVLIVCTPHYKDRSEKRLGGVGYEGDIMTSEVMTQNNARKFIPIFRIGTSWQAAAPGWLAGKYYVDLSGSAYSEDRYQDLLTTLHGTRPSPPAIGKRPTVTGHSRLASTPAPPSERPVPPVFEPIRIIGIVVDEITQPRLDGTPSSALYSVPFQPSRRPSYEWMEVFIEKWNHPRSWTSMHRPGIASISGDRVYLNGTTVEEVEVPPRHAKACR